jgi:MoaA/NifB/PqqE/SkfB family radical SAM enzyme
MALAGGEPLLRRDAIAIFERVVDSGMNLVVTTNGLLLRDSTLDALQSIDPLEVRISFDGGPSLHDSVRGKGTYIRSMRNVGRLAAAGVRVTARVTLCRDGELELPQLFRDVAGQGVEILKVALIKEAGRAATTGRHLLRPIAGATTVDYLYDLGAQHGLSVSLATDDFPVLPVDGHLSKLRDVERPNCGAGTETCYITPHGEVLTCVAMPGHTLGNITSRSFADVWLDRGARQYRQTSSTITGRLCEAGIPSSAEIAILLSPGRRRKNQTRF